MFISASHVPNRVMRATLVLCAVATTAFAPAAAWAEPPDAAIDSMPAVEVIPVQPVADLAVSQLASGNPVQVGNLLTYRLTATNHGPSTSVSVRLTDQIPVTSTFVGASAGCFANGAPVVVTCPLGNLASGATTWRSVTVRPSHLGQILNIARVSSPVTFDPVAGNIVSVVATTVIP